ncbi:MULTISPECIES: helix-turn-helix domain-containing protein [unclassified Frankia]|uniref:helix-turn-helix domain-containing protein n=1 Tax=unclassified Frankia TaxID=2632575 RepID=UPI002AD4ABCF|nr:MULTISPECIES: helix-turn-helix domain-containing protein [unclassified Frankia]
MDTEALVVDALLQLGVEARLPDDGSDGGVDLVLDPDGVAVPIELKRRSLVSEGVAAQLLEASRPPGGSGGSLLLVVADRVTEAARKVLTEHRAGYYDLRGRIALRSSSFVIDAEVSPVTGRGERTRALSGKAGLEVATTLLMEPEEGAAVRELARRLGRSPSTVSEVLATLRHDGLVDATNVVTDARLFWQVAERWPERRTYLAKLPDPGDGNGVTRSLRLGLRDVRNETGWALTDTTAAAAYGAPVAVRADQLLDFFVPDQAVLRRATTLLGAASTPVQARAAVRVAPVAAVCTRRVDLPPERWQWPLAHPLFVALDLAQDLGRGREILDAWRPDPRWARVW